MLTRNSHCFRPLPLHEFHVAVIPHNTHLYPTGDPGELMAADGGTASVPSVQQSLQRLLSGLAVRDSCIMKKTLPTDAQRSQVRLKSRLENDRGKKVFKSPAKS